MDSGGVAAGGVNGGGADHQSHNAFDVDLGGLECGMPRILPLRVRANGQLKTRKGIGEVRMRHWLQIAMGLTLAVPLCVVAQQQSQPAPPASQQPAQPSNPFPEDTNTVPVIPASGTPASAAPAPDADYSNVPLAGANTDPVRSPDDASAVPDTGGSSSSDAGLGQILKPPPDDEKSGRHHHGDGDDLAPHQETPQEDETVGSYYLGQKNWKAAQSRFESAMVLDAENPEVYWGLAESQRHLGDFAGARTNYLKVMEYDPDSKHSKEAKKYLRDPEIANAPAVSSNAGAPQK